MLGAGCVAMPYVGWPGSELGALGMPMLKGDAHVLCRTVVIDSHMHESAEPLRCILLLPGHSQSVHLHRLMDAPGCTEV